MNSTIVILSYNQEKTISQSILSAINQDEKNYTIIICDDGSTDSTTQIIRETIESCSREDIKIIFLPSMNNQGIVYNFNKSVPYIKGDFFITQAGDDISKPNRLKISKEIFMKKNISAFFSATYDIDENSNILNSNHASIIHQRNMKLGGVNLISCTLDEAGILGASAAYRTEIIKNHPLPHVTFSEDKILTLRATLVGDVVYYSKPLVEYRIGSGISIKSKTLKLMAKLMYRRSKFLKSIQRDTFLREKNFPFLDYQKKILKLRVSSVISRNVLSEKSTPLAFLCAIIYNSLYNKIILRAIYYMLRVRNED